MFSTAFNKSTLICFLVLASEKILLTSVDVVDKLKGNSTSFSVWTSWMFWFLKCLTISTQILISCSTTMKGFLRRTLAWGLICRIVDHDRCFEELLRRNVWGQNCSCLQFISSRNNESWTSTKKLPSYLLFKTVRTRHQYLSL
jgi:hypothetical protein